MRAPATATDLELTWTGGSAPAVDARWLPAVVPGGVHESLLAAGLLEDPYVGLNELDLGWVHDATWWYRGAVAGPGILRMPGLDGVAEVHLDGEPVATFRNAHRTHELSVPPGEHALLLRFPPLLTEPLDPELEQRQAEVLAARQSQVRPQDPPLPQAEVDLRVRRPQLRKATFSWGWDFAPVVTSRGVSAPVTVVTHEPLAELRVRPTDVDVTARTASLVVSGRARGDVRVEVTAPDGRVVTAEAAGDFEVWLPLTDVALWWTHDLGTPALYDVAVVVDGGRTTVRTGLRTLELDRSEDPAEGGCRFRFLLNGQPVFARGANWVPPSMLVGSVSDSTTRRLVELSVEGGMNCLRVWGGGVLPGVAFYDACDELGVLVWQDFLFACYDYPDPQGHLAAETRLEAAEQVQRLRGRACLALWCGENEVQGLHEISTGSAERGDWGWSLFNELLPAIVAAHDPDTPYWPGSPWSALGFLNGTQDGDRHAWEVWHGLDVGAGGPTDYPSRAEALHFSRYEHDRGRFISEFGLHAAPERATLERWAGPLELDSPELAHRNKDTPPDKAFLLMEAETGLPTTLQEYVDFSMACQAEGLKLGVEHYRRRQPHCNGTLVWQLNDSWPGLSWSVVDFDLVPKHGYWALQRAFAPVVASFRVDGEVLELWVTSSTLEPVDLQLTVDVGPLTGLGERTQISCTASGLSSAPVWRGTVVHGSQVASVVDAHDRVPANRRFLARLKDLPVRDGRVTAKVVRDDSTAQVVLTARGYAYQAAVLCDTPGARFSTNYLDLRDGQAAVVDVTHLPPAARLSVSSYGQHPQEI